MSLRIDYAHQSPELFRKYLEMSMALKKSVIDEKLQALVEIRASQLNGCAFCLDMHVKQAKIAGERELRLYHVSIWRESNLFTPKERAALEWTEAVTKLDAHGVSDAIFESARKELSEKELTDLTFVLMVINGWNRASIAFRAVPGSQDEVYGLAAAGLS
ncbi:carboxymuconolactone decarboxylase family protein [Terriglobus sp. RCC_193]|uniref:carboxymuconolactone decarboxylase family protein n=1 Tax=Terriglobus sp. RCC_193 TaxID=3239218 RepID=UPI00352581C0